MLAGLRSLLTWQWGERRNRVAVGCSPSTIRAIAHSYAQWLCARLVPPNGQGSASIRGCLFTQVLNRLARRPLVDLALPGKPGWLDTFMGRLVTEVFNSSARFHLWTVEHSLPLPP